jgi:hypothetical protein
MIRYCARCDAQVSWLRGQGRYVHVAPQDHDAIVPAQTVPTESFVETLAANVRNAALNDAEFRAFVRRTLPIVKGEGPCRP